MFEYAWSGDSDEHHVVAAGVEHRLEHAEHLGVAVHDDHLLHRLLRDPAQCQT
jgi:hypothetical protein